MSVKNERTFNTMFVPVTPNIMVRLSEKWEEVKFEPKYDYLGPAEMGGDLLPETRDPCDRDYVEINDDTGDIIGYIHYRLCYGNSTARGFLLVSFENSPIFIRHVIEHAHLIFNRWGMNRIEFIAIDGNPALDGYRKLITRYGGVECGHFHQSITLRDNTVHDDYVFEILAEDFHNKVHKEGDNNEPR